MRPPPTAPARSDPRRFLAFALALLVALHGLAAGVVGALGRLHSHGPARVVVLDDLRRGAPHEGARRSEASARHGHSHGGASTLRHHHAAGDMSVLPAADDAAQGLDADAASSAASLAAFVALLQGTSTRRAATASDPPAPTPGWVPSTHRPDPFERPPRPT